MVPLSKDAFRNAMAKVCGSVNLITTSGEAGRGGFIATAMCSVTDDPPTLLVCMNQKSQQCDTFIRNGCFCVNVLGEDDQELARIFAGKVADMDERYAAAEWQKLDTGAPVLRSAITACDCVLADRYEIGTHHILIGRIVGHRVQDGARSLLYFDRQFGSFAATPAQGTS